jgi:hypothetical protein
MGLTVMVSSICNHVLSVVIQFISLPKTNLLKEQLEHRVRRDSREKFSYEDRYFKYSHQ